MNKTILSLCTLTSAISMSIATAGKPVQAASAEGPEIPAKMRSIFYVAVHEQVLQHLNGKVSIADRFSRTLRPMPSRYYEAELVTNGKKAMMFNLILNDRSNPQKPVREISAVGKYYPATKEIRLYDKGVELPAKAHPLLGGKTKTS